MLPNCIATSQKWKVPCTIEFEGFRLVGNQYQAIAPNNRGWRWSEELSLYLGVEAGQLRYFTPEGDQVPTPEEAAVQERQARELAQQRAERLAQRLRRCEAACRQTSLGIDPDAIST